MSKACKLLTIIIAYNLCRNTVGIPSHFTGSVNVNTFISYFFNYFGWKRDVLIQYTAVCKIYFGKMMLGIKLLMYIASQALLHKMHSQEVTWIINFWRIQYPFKITTLSIASPYSMLHLQGNNIYFLLQKFKWRVWSKLLSDAEKLTGYSGMAISLSLY